MEQRKVSHSITEKIPSMIPYVTINVCRDESASFLPWLNDVGNKMEIIYLYSSR